MFHGIGNRIAPVFREIAAIVYVSLHVIVRKRRGKEMTAEKQAEKVEFVIGGERTYSN